MPDDPKVRVVFSPMNRVAEINTGATVLDAIRSTGIQFECICGGSGECRKCRVIFVHGDCDIGAPGTTDGLTEAEIADRYCLACRTRVSGDSEFIIPVESRIDRPKILDRFSTGHADLRPSAVQYAVGRQDSAAPAMARSLRIQGYTGQRPRMTREQHDLIVGGAGPCTVTISTSRRHPEIIAIDDGDVPGPNYGLAIDLGTTTIAGALIDLNTGKILGSGTVLNPQITYGEELITRIAVAKDHGGSGKLKKAAADGINALIAQLARSVAADTGRINDVCIGGNTVMGYLLEGLDPRPLEIVDSEISRSPHIFKAQSLGLATNPHAYVYCLPHVSRFVGGDAIGDVVASGISGAEELCLCIDLGTNGEVVFGNRDWLASASCASGPAFEGAGIASGMRAMIGAIEHVAIDPGTREVRYRTIGDIPPRGICGSGIIDTVAGMAGAGILDFSGKIVEGMPHVREGAGGPEFILVPKEASGTGRDIAITGPDLLYLMDSKAAACGAIGVLMKKYHITVHDVRHVFFAGAFGTYADVDKLVAFGFIPRFPNAEHHFIGNGSLSGACSALLSAGSRKEMESAAGKMAYIDLLVEQDFIEEYTAALYIPGKKEYFP
jgi:uncharacterized 2Fe-2S/4Fe-4S cluster protein (DUF4445 family)